MGSGQTEVEINVQKGRESSPCSLGGREQSRLTTLGSSDSTEKPSFKIRSSPTTLVCLISFSSMKWNNSRQKGFVLL